MAKGKIEVSNGYLETSNVSTILFIQTSKHSEISWPFLYVQLVVGMMFANSLIRFENCDYFGM